MKLLFALLFIIFSAAVFGQPDTGNRSIMIPANPPTPELEKPVTKPFELPPTIKDPYTEANKRSLLAKDNNIDLTQKNNFDSPSKIYEDKLNKRGDGSEGKVFRKHQYLGDFKTTSKSVNINYRDFGLVDGDVVRIWVNDKVIKEQVYLEGNFKGFELELVKGFNKIDFEALKEGYSLPNTAELRIYDDKGEILTAEQWNLATGFKATIIVVQE